MTASDPIELFSAKVCPFAHRTRLVLAEKDLDFVLTEIDFKAKPERFLKISRYGRVPAIVHGEAEIYESRIINEYLDEVFPTPSMMPVEPRGRALARIWMDYCDSRFTRDHYKALKNPDPAEDAAWRDKVNGHLEIIEEAMERLSDGGPYWFGAAPGLVDFTYFPFFERLPAWEHYRGLGIPASCVRLKAWLAAMAERPSVKAIANSPEYYVGHYASYAGERIAA